jgi:hypothetical protein
MILNFNVFSTQRNKKIDLLVKSTSNYYFKHFWRFFPAKQVENVKNLVKEF